MKRTQKASILKSKVIAWITAGWGTFFQSDLGINPPNLNRITSHNEWYELKRRRGKRSVSGLGVSTLSMSRPQPFPNGWGSKRTFTPFNGYNTRFPEQRLYHQLGKGKKKKKWRHDQLSEWASYELRMYQEIRNFLNRHQTNICGAVGGKPSNATVADLRKTAKNDERSSFD